jgi:hypothetical protein
LASQPWWGNSSLALDFATAYSADASSPLNIRSYFAFGENSDPQIIDAAYAVRYVAGVENVISGAYRSQTERYILRPGDRLCRWWFLIQTSASVRLRW